MSRVKGQRVKDENNQDWLGSSPDGIIEQDGILKTVIEIKCPYMGGKPIPYKNVCTNHIPQIILEMFCTSTQQCHYVVWTPIGTKVMAMALVDGIKTEPRVDNLKQWPLNYFITRLRQSEGQ